ncbi:MAG: enolase C-terminal domain-like protein, partial [Acidobacteriaceae bacterium]
MASCFINRIDAFDMRYPLPPGAGTDAVHTNPEYSLAVTYLGTAGAGFGTGITLTLGAGNRLVCDAIEILAVPLLGREIEELMAEFGKVSNLLANNPAMRWLGPHKGVVHLALASITNACFDLWAKSRGVPLWKLLLDLTPEQLVALLDLSNLEGYLCEDAAIDLVRNHWS